MRIFAMQSGANVHRYYFSVVVVVWLIPRFYISFILKQDTQKVLEYPEQFHIFEIHSQVNIFE